MGGVKYCITLANLLILLPHRNQSTKTYTILLCC